MEDVDSLAHQVGLVAVCHQECAVSQAAVLGRAVAAVPVDYPARNEVREDEGHQVGDCVDPHSGRQHQVVESARPVHRPDVGVCVAGVVLLAVASDQWGAAQLPLVQHPVWVPVDLLV